MQLKELIVCSILVITLAGCAASNAHKFFAYGPEPTVEQIEETTKSLFQRALIDPWSAHYEYGKPYKAYYLYPLISGGGVNWQGWAVDVRVNSKNRMGGYAGWTVYHVGFTQGRAVNAWEAQETEVLFQRAD